MMGRWLMSAEQLQSLGMAVRAKSERHGTPGIMKSTVQNASCAMTAILENAQNRVRRFDLVPYTIGTCSKSRVLILRVIMPRKAASL